MPYQTVSNNVKLYYERRGNGPPLLLIMGTGLDHTCWNAQVDAYAPQYDCIAFDNRGTGRSEAPDEPITMQQLAVDTAGLTDGLGISRAHVSGLSLGSCVAQELALMRPELVATVEKGLLNKAMGVFVDDVAAGGVDQTGATLHLAQPLAAHQTAGFSR